MTGTTRNIFSKAVSYFFPLYILLPVFSFSQTTIISGKITDALTNEPVSFANIFFKGTTQGVRADMDGNYKIVTEKAVDTLSVTFLGYKTVNMKVKRGQTQVINISMHLDQFELNAVEIKAGENPADIIMRKVIEHRDKNDRENIKAYEYEVYNKLEFDISNISEKFKKKKVLKPIAFIFNNLDSSETNKKPFLPVFVSESLSDFYYTSDPSQKKEIIKATKVSGIDNATVSQFLGDMYQNVNIYKNYIDLFRKNFVSPLNGSGFLFYKYYLTDSSYIDNQWCYKIVFKPKRKQELTFSGELWIHDTTFAVKKVNMRMSPDANINFVEDIAIVQEFVFLNGIDSVWMKKKDIYVVNFISQNESTGFIGRKTASYKNFVINHPKSDNFFATGEDVIISDSAMNKDETFWLNSRHDSLSRQEKAVYHMVDTIKSLPVYKTYVDVITFMITGYVAFGKIELGPFPKTYSFNKYEGDRFRLGGRTNWMFSKDLTLEGYIAYGTKDNAFKYSGSFKYYVSRKPWQSVSATYKHDVEEFGQSQNVFQGYRIAGRQKDGVFLEGDIVSSIVRREKTNKFTNIEEYSGYYEVDWTPGFSTKFRMVHNFFLPLGDLNYEYYTNGTDGTTKSTLTNSEISITTRLAINEKFIQGKKNRLSLGSKYPIFFINYTHGFKDVFGSDFEYNKISARVDGKVSIRPLGYSIFLIEAGQTLETLPYPLLEVHRGNETYGYRNYDFNMMNNYEFVSDRYILALLSHHFNGLFFDKLPLLRKLKFREVVTLKSVIGSLKESNRNILVDDSNISSFTHPYFEGGMGVENIFKIVRVEAVWRLNYLDKPNVSRFAVMATLQLTF